jgi:hypothetical protein
VVFVRIRFSATTISLVGILGFWYWFLGFCVEKVCVLESRKKWIWFLEKFVFVF